MTWIEAVTTARWHGHRLITMRRHVDSWPRIVKCGECHSRLLGRGPSDVTGTFIFQPCPARRITRGWSRHARTGPRPSS